MQNISLDWSMVKQACAMSSQLPLRRCTAAQLHGSVPLGMWEGDSRPQMAFGVAACVEEQCISARRE